MPTPTPETSRRDELVGPAGRRSVAETAPLGQSYERLAATRRRIRMSVGAVLECQFQFWHHSKQQAVPVGYRSVLVGLDAQGLRRERQPSDSSVTLPLA